MSFVWPHPTAPEEVDEKPLAEDLSDGAAPAATRMSCEARPWRPADDVGPFSFGFDLNSIPEPQREHFHQSSATAHADNQAGTSKPARLFWPAGPSPQLPTSQPLLLQSRSSYSSSFATEHSITLPRVSIRTARLELLVSTWRAMDYFNDAAAYGHASYVAAVHTAGTVWRVATSKTARRTLVTTVLFGAVSVVLFGVACVGYAAFYHAYLPDQVVTVPMHLQYGYTLNPYAVVDLSGQSFAAYQDYDISVTLHLPRSPANLAHNNFMLALYLVDNAPPPPEQAVPSPADVLVGRHIIHTSTRAAIVPYTDPLVSLASRVLFLAYHIFVPASETITLTVPLVERLEFVPGVMNPTTLVVDVQAGQTLQVYSAAVTITAQLAGLRWFMHKWWISSFLLFTLSFWLCEVFFLAMSLLVLRLLFGSSSSSSDKASTGPKTIKNETGPPVLNRKQAIKQEEDVPMTFPTLSGQQPLRYDPAPSHTNGLDAAAVPPTERGGGEADDEEDEDEARDYEAEERARDSGIGTSYSERDSGSVRRRTSRGRLGS